MTRNKVRDFDFNLYEKDIPIYRGKSLSWERVKKIIDNLDMKFK